MAISYVVFIDAVADIEVARCLALRAVWGSLAAPKSTYKEGEMDEGQIPFCFDTTGAAFSFVMQCASSDIKHRGPIQKISN
jgi:hypothetical protein